MDQADMQSQTGHGDAKTANRPIHVLVCPDQPSWAFDNIANNIERYAGHNRISKLYMREIIGQEHLFYEAVFLKRIDLCHIFWREDLFHLLNPDTIKAAAQQLELDFETMVRAINSCAFTTSVYDHLFSRPQEIHNRRGPFSLIDGYTVSSPKLYKIYADTPGLPIPDIIIPDGVDTDHFSPCPQSESENEKQEFLLGWVGNSDWGKQSQGYDVKGFHRIFKPMLAHLQTRGHAVTQAVADPQIKRIPFEEMPDFYRNLDIFVCTSAMEGTPNPVLEAMACGIPVVSSDVGIVNEAAGALQKQFVIASDRIDDFANAVAALLQDRELRTAIGAENRRQSLSWSWESKTKDWWPFWVEVVKRAMEPRNAIRREHCILSSAW